MDNNTQQGLNSDANVNINKTADFINNVYDNLSYYDLYGNSVLLFLFLTLFVFLVYSFCKIGITKESIASDWVNQRCKPQNIPFAGFITKPEGKTAFEYTGENFQYCVQNILLNITSYSLLPFQYATNSIVNLFNTLGTAIDKIRVIMSSIRGNMQTFAEDVLHRILNTLVPLQSVFLAVKDTFNKIQAIMVSGLFTMLGSYYTLQALMGAILELIIKVLIVLVVIIVGLWILPFTWPAAAGMTAVFLGISIPLAIIIYFMTEVLHIQSAGIPKLRCFDKNVKIVKQNGDIESIEHIQVGDVLEDGSKVTSKIKVTSGDLMMFDLNGTIVSESHVVRHKGKWIYTKTHPDAVLINNYTEPYLYCLNTTSKILKINGTIFTDWDELYGKNLDVILVRTNNKISFSNNRNNIVINDLKNIHRFLDDGFRKNELINIVINDETISKKISEINIGDDLGNNNIVYGIVEIDKKGIDKYEKANCLKNDLDDLEKNNVLYHLLTTHSSFSINGNKVNDYNGFIDSNLFNLGKIKSNL